MPIRRPCLRLIYRAEVDAIVKTIKKHGEPIDIEALHGMLSYESPAQVRALASLSKGLASLKDVWGLVKWPTVNPKNIRDKIYVILADNGKPMHFSDIATHIKDSDFKRKDVTTQAIHNELIKDKRFVLIGRYVGMKGFSFPPVRRKSRAEVFHDRHR